jgi:hypothetical protein
MLTRVAVARCHGRAGGGLLEEGIKDAHALLR